MAEDDSSYSPTTAEANRARMQGLGVGQKEMDRQRDPNRDLHAIDPGRPEPFDATLEAGPPAEHTPQVLAGRIVEPARADEEPRTFDRAEDTQTPWLGEGVPSNVDVRDTGDDDNPQNDWGGPAGEGAMHGVNHTRRPERTEAMRGQGPKTRKATKDIISRRS